MFYNSDDFRALEAGTHLAWMQQELSLQNLANVETPGYKAKRLAFGNALENAIKSETQPKTISGEIIEDQARSNRPDGNNVDQESESVALYQDYAQYSMLLAKMKSSFDQYSYVLNANMK